MHEEITGFLVECSREQISEHTAMVVEFLSFNAQHLQGALSSEKYLHAQEMNEKINGYQKRYKKATQKRLRTGSSVKTELFYLDLLRHIEHIGDYSLLISQALVQMR
ncbi:MAG: hypothetical protein WD492_02415 [Alkalispirochaeta sp.]